MAYNVQEGTEQNSVSNFCKEAKVTSSIQYTQTQTGTSRYRYVGDDPKTVTLGDLTQESTRYTGSRATLYANGQAVATNRSASLYDNGRAYFGTDILGSVRSATDDYASLEDRYEYDIFGTPYEGDFTTGLNNGYTGKPYDTTTGLYNYGYRDYSPQQARFTTVDPIRDGNNWFSYVVNDPVNYVDLWGLMDSSIIADGLKNLVDGASKILTGLGIYSLTGASAVLTAGAATPVAVAGAIGGSAFVSNGWVQLSIGIAELIGGFTAEEPTTENIDKKSEQIPDTLLESVSMSATEVYTKITNEETTALLDATNKIDNIPPANDFFGLLFLNTQPLYEIEPPLISNSALFSNKKLKNK